MFRAAILLLAGMFFCADAQAGFWDDMKAKIEATRLATIKARKLPPVKFTEKQMASLNKLNGTTGRIVWLGAGREKDGKIYVCHVVVSTNWTGKKVVSLLSGRIEADDSYEQTAAQLWRKSEVLAECNRHGFDPPVRVH